MPNIDICGLVTREVKYGENSRILTVIGKDIGKVSVMAGRARTNKSGLLTATQLFSYSDFTLFKGRENSLLKMNEGEVIETFSDIRTSLDKMAYASYFCDIANHLCPDGAEENELLSLLLNVLFMLNKTECNEDEETKLEAIFQFRALAIAGFAPNSDGCGNCGNAENVKYFDRLNGVFFCSSCGAKQFSNISEVNTSLLNAIKYITTMPIKNLFAFKLGQNAMKYLAHLGEEYVRDQLGHEFKTLDYLKKVQAL